MSRDETRRLPLAASALHRELRRPVSGALCRPVAGAGICRSARLAFNIRENGSAAQPRGDPQRESALVTRRSVGMAALHGLLAVKPAVLVAPAATTVPNEQGASVKVCSCALRKRYCMLT